MSPPSNQRTFARSRHKPRRLGRPPRDFQLNEANLDELAAAAQSLVVDGYMDGELALSFVVWPDGVPPDILDRLSWAVNMTDTVRCRRETSRS